MIQKVSEKTGINWLMRLKNKTTLLSLATAIVTFIYTVLGLFGVVPPISQNEIIELVTVVVNMLFIVGIVNDPSTSGITDSKEAMTYTEPKKD